jgi:hypothetical protein
MKYIESPQHPSGLVRSRSTDRRANSAIPPTFPEPSTHLSEVATMSSPVPLPAPHGPGPDHTTDTESPTHLTVVAWFDPFLAQHGYDPRSAYVERFWLGVLGPSATWLVRRLARGLDSLPDGFRINLADTARALGLGEGTGRNSMVVRTVERTCQFGAAQLHARDRLAVRTHLAPLNARQLKRLPLAVQTAHDTWMNTPIDDEQRRRAVTLAVGLLERGVDQWTVEQHLASYGFADRLAHEASRDAAVLSRRAEQHPPPAAA